MKRRFVGPLAIVAVSALSLPALAAEAVEPNAQQGMESVQNGSQHWAADRQMMLDAKLAGMKAELKLKPDQEKLWTPFETAVRDSAKDRMENMQKMMEMRKQNEQASPIDLLDDVVERPHTGRREHEEGRRGRQAALREPRRDAEA